MPRTLAAVLVAVTALVSGFDPAVADDPVFYAQLRTRPDYEPGAGSPVRDDSATPSRDPEFTVRIATVQAGHTHYAKGNPGLEANFNALASQARVAAKERPDLIVFPEYAISGWPYPNEAVINGFEIKPFARHLGQKYGGAWDERAGYFNVRQPAAYGALVEPATRPPWTSIFLSQAGEAQTREQLLKRFHGRYDANEPGGHPMPLVQFAAPWTSPFRVDPEWPHQLVNREGEHLLILNKTAWAFFGCQDPGGYLDRARGQEVNVIRVALEGRPYWSELGLELWPWGGTRAQPDWNSYNETYWQRVEERVRLAGEKGIGLDVVLYTELHPDAKDIPAQQRYWNEIVVRLGKYANILTWEIANEYTRNEKLQDAAGRFFKERDPQHRPVCTSDGTTDDAVWPGKPWLDLAINHTCTSSTPRHDLRDWYLAVARNTRAHGKPAWCNESGREQRHRNDDGVHRRKQGWLWYAAGCFWTWHSWDGCEGINDRAYRAPGEAYLRPMVRTFRALPFWRMNPNQTVAVMGDPTLVQAALATAERDFVLIYCCTRETGRAVSGTNMSLRLPDGAYRLSLLKPADGTLLETRDWVSKGLGQEGKLALPSFTDDLAVRIERMQPAKRTTVPGTQ